MAQSLSMSMFERFTGGGARDRLSQSAAVPESPVAPSLPPLGLVEVSLEGLPHIFVTLRVHSEQDLQVGVAQAFGFRSTADFEILRSSHFAGNSSDRGEEQRVKVRVLSRSLLNEVAHIESLYREVVDFEAEVVYSQLAKISGIPLLRLHRAIAPACGEAVASWLATYHEELRQVTSLRDSKLQDAAGQRVWRALQHRIEAVFPSLVDRLPQHLKMLPPADASPEEHLEYISSLFSQILDEVRLRVLPLRTLRTTANGTWDTKRVRPGSKRLLRVSFQGNSEGQASGRQRPTVFIAALDAPIAGPSSTSSASGAGSAVGSSSPCGGAPGSGTAAGSEGEGQASCGFTGHDLYYQVARFFGLTHVEVRSRDGILISLEKPDESLLGHLPGVSDGICLDLVASRYEPQLGSYDQLYREVLRILGPRHFKLDQSYRLQLQCSEEMLTTTQGNALISTVIVIPINYLEGKQMYLFRSPRHRQCAARLRTFEEFKEMLQTLVQVYEQLTNQMSPAQAERLRGNCAEGALGQTPLAPFEGSRVHSLSQTWQLMHGEATAGRSVMGLLGGFQTSSAPKVGSSFSPLAWFMPEEMLVDPEVLYVAHDVLCDYYHGPGGVRCFLGGGSFSGVADATAPKARSVFDRYGIDQIQAHHSAAQRWSLPQWWRSPHQPEAAELQVAPWTDPWSIVVGGLVGVLFGLFEGVYGSANEQSLYSSTNTRILEKMARRGFIGLGVSATFHYLGRLLRQCQPGSRYAAVSRKSVLASQAVVFLGTAAWAVASRQKYVSPGFFRRLWVQDLNLAEFQAAGIILTSGLACSFSFGGYVLGAQVLGGSLGGPVGAFAGSLMPLFISVALVGLDWWHDRRRRLQMKAAALQTLGLPEPSELGSDIFKPMLSTRYKLLACYLHPDKNDNCRCDTKKVFSQIRLAKEILEQELKDYQGCPRERLRRLFEQMCALCGYRRDRYVCEHPTGIVMNILEDGPVRVEDLPVDLGLEPASAEGALASPRRHGFSSPSQTPSQVRRRSRSASSRSGIDSLTTVESRSLSESRSPSRGISRGRRGRPAAPETNPHPQEWARRPSRPRTPRDTRHRSEGVIGSGDSEEPPWVMVPGKGGARHTTAEAQSLAAGTHAGTLDNGFQSSAPPC